MNTAQIEWRTIVEFPEFEVSNMGQIRRVVASKGGHKFLPLPYLLRPTRMNTGYLMVSFWRDGRRYCRTVHRLVALAFLPREEGRDDVAHGDGTRDNNAVSNLRWATPSENALDRHRHGTMQKARAVINPDIVAGMKAARLSGKTYKEVAKAFGVCRTTAMRAITGASWAEPGGKPAGLPPGFPKFIFRPHNVKGERHNKAKLTDAIVAEILQSQEKSADLAKKYGVGYRVIYDIRVGKRWTHIPRPPSHAGTRP